MQQKPNCDSCGAPIIWRVGEETKRNPQPKPNPIDAAPNSEKGNILLLENNRYRVIGKNDLEKAKKLNYILYTSHFATCPNARQHRRK